MTITVSAFYKFVAIANPEGLRREVLERAQSHDIKGTILIAGEGINGTISGAPLDMAAFLDWLKADARFQDLMVKSSFAPEHTFKRLKIKVKREILTFGIPEADPTKQVGVYVSPQKWNELIQDPEVIVIDTRNDYEVNIGTFQNAVNPHTRAFTQFPDFVKNTLPSEKKRKVAMFCTGGIRCEKASSYMLREGYDEVYHLQGGILKYLEEIPSAESLWQGECFVFDERVAVKHGMAIGSYELCEACGYPIAKLEKAKSVCPHCASLKPANTN